MQALFSAKKKNGSYVNYLKLMRKLTAQRSELNLCILPTPNNVDGFAKNLSNFLSIQELKSKTLSCTSASTGHTPGVLLWAQSLTP